MYPRTARQPALPTRMPLRRLGRWLAVLLAGSLATLGLGAPAQAGPGTGTALFWTYFNATDFAFHGIFPGVQAFANGIDTNGSRSMSVTLKDIAADDKCANVNIHIQGQTDIGKRVCGNGKQLTFPVPAATGQMLISVFRTLAANGQSDRTLHLAIPDSSIDTDIRTANTIVSLSYSGASNFSYEIRRPGVRLTGNGVNSGSNKIVDGTLRHTGAIGTCAIAKAAGTPPINVANCSPAAPDEVFTTTLDQSDNMQGCLLVSATATTRCSTLMLPTT